MAVSPSKRSRVLCAYIIFCYLLKPISPAGLFYKLIESKDKQNCVADEAPHIHQEFFQCSREQSCTHVVRLLDKCMLVYGSRELGNGKHEANCIYEKMSLSVTSCLDLYHRGRRKNGVYEVLDNNNMTLPVMCDFESEANRVWTLVSSFSLRNKDSLQFTKSRPRNETNPNWLDYRIGLPKMLHIRSASAMWRATCSFPKYKSDIYRDYVRALLSEFDILQFNGFAICFNIDYINVRGHESRNITVPIWQTDVFTFHIDTSLKVCQYDARAGSAYSEDNFGLYQFFNRNFRCTETDDSTTQHWFGDKV